MFVYSRKVVRGSKKRFDYSINIPAEVVRKLELQDSYVQIKLEKDTIIMKKISGLEHAKDSTVVQVKKEEPSDFDEITH